MGVPPWEQKSADASAATITAVQATAVSASLAQRDPWLLAIPEMVSMRTFFLAKMLNNSGFIPPHVEREKF